VGENNNEMGECFVCGVVVDSEEIATPFADGAQSAGVRLCKKHEMTAERTFEALGLGKIATLPSA
jgi:hypothetical protein